MKYEEVYTKEYTTIEHAKIALAAYFQFYNYTRPHQELAYETPAQVHLALAPPPPVDMTENCARRLRIGNVLPAQFSTYPQAQPQPSVV